MANRYHTTNPQRKIHCSNGGQTPKSGPIVNIKEKPAFPTAHVPGKTQKARSGKTEKCKIYPNSEGL